MNLILNLIFFCNTICGSRAIGILDEIAGVCWNNIFIDMYARVRAGDNLVRRVEHYERT